MENNEGRGRSMMIRNRASTFKNEAALIQEVKIRPVIYDKTKGDYRKPGKTDIAWAEVSDILSCTVVSCKKRWKSLRDTFIKYYRMELMTNSDNLAGKRRNSKLWMFYDDMSFLREHVELFGLSEQETEASFESKCGIVRAKDENTYEIAYPTDYDNMDVEDLAEIEEVDDERNDYVVESLHGEQSSSQGEQYIIHNSQQHSKEHEYEIRRKGTSEIEFESLPFDEPSSSYKGDPEPKSVSTATSDSDERFLLSCAPALKRLNARKNAYVRLSIQHLLYDVEFTNEEPVLKKPKL